MENIRENKVSFFTKIAVILFVAFAILISWAILKQINKEKQIQNEISKLKEEAKSISQENFLAQERISYFESADYQKQEAKEKLNLKNPDENVIIVKPEVTKKEIQTEEGAPETFQEKKETLSNPKKWWRYLANK